MNRSWNSKQNSSTGFVYFNQTTPKSSNDSQDFLAFNESPTSNNYNQYNRPSSSPYGSPNYHSSPRFHRSPRKFNLRNSYRYSGGHRGNRSFDSPNSGYHSWGNHRSPNQHFNNRQNNRPAMMNRDGTKDMSMFYDPTSLENPWESLEAELEKKIKEDSIASKESIETKSEITVETEGKDEDAGSSESGSEEGSSDSDSDSEEQLQKT